MQFAKALGLNVICIDARDEGLQVTFKSGADIVIDARKGREEVVRQARGATDGEGATCTLNLREAVKTACAVTKTHGTVARSRRYASLTFPKAS